MYYAPLCLFAQKYLHDADESEEVVQAFFLKLWEDRSKIEITISLKSYLFGAVRNRCLNFIKHQKIKQDYETEVVNSISAENYAANSFLEVDLLKKIEESINALPPRRREIFILSREHGLKYREIAEKMNISVKTVEAQMGQALKDLRENLKVYKQLLISFFITLEKSSIRVLKQQVVSEMQTRNSE